MIYTESPITDWNNIVQHIDCFTTNVGQTGVLVDSEVLRYLCTKMRENFPHTDGIDKASTFKKAASFMAHFLEMKPIKSEPTTRIPGLSSYDLNAVVALDIAIICIEKSSILQKDGAPLIISNPIYISDHSYVDMIEALSSEYIIHKTHFHLLHVLLEQITYKTNSHCEYKPGSPGDEGGVSGSATYYPQLLPGGDDLYGV